MMLVTGLVDLLEMDKHAVTSYNVMLLIYFKFHYVIY